MIAAPSADRRRGTPRRSRARVFALLVVLALASAVRAQDGPPTVVLVTAEWHRADHIARAFQGVDLETPHLDGLLRRGVLFTDAYTPSTSSRAAAAALHTATSPLRTLVLDDVTRLGDAAPTLAEVFAQEGYTTLAVLGGRPFGAAASGLGQGFARVLAPVETARRPAADVVADALRELAAADGRPVFLWVHLADALWPHEPLQSFVDACYGTRDDPRDARLKLSAARRRMLPPEYQDLTDPNWAWCRYKAVISGMDAALGALLDVPRVQAGVVGYVGLQGMSLGHSAPWYRSAGLLPGVLRVPLVIASPEGPRDARDEDAVSTLDVGRTLLDHAGLGSAAFPGHDLLSPDTMGRTQRVALESHGLAASLTRDGMHLVLPLQARRMAYLPRPRAAHQATLFDLTADPQAEHDLLAPSETGELILDDMGESALAMLRDLVQRLGAVDYDGWGEPGEPDPDGEAWRDELGDTGPPVHTRLPLWVPDGCGVCRWAALPPR